MKIILVDDQSNFFVDLWNSIIKFWFGTGAEDATTPYFYNVIAAAIWFVLSYLLIKVILYLTRKGMGLSKRMLKERTAKSFILDALRVVLYIVDFVILLLILRVDMSGMSTVFSSAILAIGLSLQSVVGNFASGLIILGSKPFGIGDYVLIKGCAEGTVVSVRFLSTTLDTIDGQRVFISNSTVIGSVITNYTINPTRRLNIGITVSYDESPEQVRKFLLNVIKSEKRILKTPEPKVIVGGIDNNGVTYNIRCQTNTNDYWDIIYKVNEQLVVNLKKEQLKIQPSKVEFLSVEPVKKETIK